MYYHPCSPWRPGWCLDAAGNPGNNWVNLQAPGSLTFNLGSRREWVRYSVRRPVARRRPGNIAASALGDAIQPAATERLRSGALARLRPIEAAEDCRGEMQPSRTGPRSHYPGSATGAGHHNEHHRRAW